MPKLTFILLLFTLLSCTSSKKENQEVKKDSIQSNTVVVSPDEQVNQTVHKIASNKDSIVLIGSAPFYNRVQIFRKQKKVLDFTEMDLQIIGTDNNGNESNWFAEHGYGDLYIIRIFNGPEPDRFLIIKNADAKTTILGITEPNSAEIFGDVDHDGKFEIGGLKLFCQGGDNNCHPEDHYQVFELIDNFPTDSVLTNYFKQFLKKK